MGQIIPALDILRKTFLFTSLKKRGTQISDTIWGVSVSGDCDTSSVAFSSSINTDSRIGWTVNYPNHDTLKATEKPQVTRCGRPGKIPDKILLLTLTEVLD
ncbi:hypothetical protein TNCV_4857711 [Trichonephila clavipes]|nr:hypothetical protein TNCV_4857711 [Trichonephila clavipes]